MIQIKIKVFLNQSGASFLQDEVNKWLEEENPSVIEMKPYVTCDITGLKWLYTLTILYSTDHPTPT